jgi:tetratricopeptide (TPR) repeat protein
MLLSLDTRDHDISRAKALLEESLTLSRKIEDIDGIGSRSGYYALFSAYSGDYARAVSLAQEGVEAMRKVGNIFWAGRIQLFLVNIHLAQENYQEASRQAQICLIDGKNNTHVPLTGEAIQALQMIAWAEGDFKRAMLLGQSGIELAQKNPARSINFIFRNYYSCGLTASSLGEYSQAKQFFMLALNNKEAAVQSMSLSGFGVFLYRLGKPQQAVRIFASDHTRFETRRLSYPVRARQEHDKALADIRQVLGEEAFRAAWEEGQALSLPQAVEYLREVIQE